jgi:hypothetical protein
VLQHSRDPCFANKALLLNRIVGKFAAQHLVANDPRQVQALARLDQRFAALAIVTK